MNSSLFFKIINHRDFVLSLAIVLGLIFGELTSFLSGLSTYLLMIAMVASTVNFSFSSWNSFSSFYKPVLGSFLLNYVLFGAVTLGLAWIASSYFGYLSLWIGFVIVVAAPPGPAVIPFSAMLNGNTTFATTGLFGLYFLAMIVTPLILYFFIGASLVSPMVIFLIMVKLIIIPIIVSRFLRHPKIIQHSRKYSGLTIKWLFFLILTPIIGMSRDVFFQEPLILIITLVIFIISMFLLAFFYNYVISKYYNDKGLIISSTFMMTIKSAAFAAVVSLRFFKDDSVVAIPAAVLSLFIILFAITYSYFVNNKLHRFMK